MAGVVEAAKIMPLRSRNLRDFAYPIVYPGSATVNVLVVGDSHTSGMYGADEGRWYMGLCAALPITIKGFWHASGDNYFHSNVYATGGTHTVTALNVGPTQHATHGSIAPFTVNECTWSADEDGVLVSRQDHNSVMAYLRGGNPFRSAALNATLWYYRTTDGVTDIRMRSGYTDDSYTQDATGVDLSGATGYATRTQTIASADKLARWDMITGGASEAGKRFLPLGGVRWQHQDPTGGVSLYFIGNSGASATDYVDTTICSDTALAGLMSFAGGFDRIIWILGTNMEAAESAAITTVWKAQMIAAARRWGAASISAGRTPMHLFITGHDSNITARLSDMATACDEAAKANGDIASVDTAGGLPNYTVTNARYLKDGVHFNLNGSFAVPGALAMAMQSAVDVSPVSDRVSRNWR